MDQKKSEKEILKRMSEGDSRAFEWLFLKYHPRLTMFLSRMTGDHDAAIDLAQDIFLDVWNGRGRFSDIDNFSSYLFRMARYKVYNYYDRLSVRERFRTEFLHGEVEMDDIEPDVFARNLSDLIVRTANEMSPRCKEVFMMSRFLEIPNAEIARLLGIDKRTVENHMTRALGILRKAVNLSLVFVCLGLLGLD